MPLKHGAGGKEEPQMNQREADMLREKYPNHIPLQQASEYLGVSPRQLSKLIAEGREPFLGVMLSLTAFKNHGTSFRQFHGFYFK